jgi:hypothetical protein
MCHYYMEIQSDSFKHSDVTAEVEYKYNSSSLAEGNYVNLREGGTLMTEGCKVMTVIMEGIRRPANHSFTISRDWI